MDGPRQYVLFSVQGQVYGIDILRIREVLVCRTITPLPGLKAFVKGVTNLRGVLVPIFDLRERFGIPEVSKPEKEILAVAEMSGRWMGLLMDEVTDVVEIASADVQGIGDLQAAIPSRFIQGVGDVGGRFIVLLDLDRLLSREEMESLETDQG